MRAQRTSVRSAPVLLILLVAAAFLSVPLAGGRLSALADLSFRSVPLLLAAVAVQALIMEVAPHGDPGLHRAVHIATYAAGAWVLVRNRHIPGLWLIGLGGLANFAAIVANGGVMPALPAAVATAGLPDPAGFVNSAPSPHPALWFLGDVFAIPAAWPLSNVFSAGDIAIALGTFLFAHLTCGSRLAPARGGELAALRADRRFARLWLAQAVSGMGDWVYSLAAITVAATRGGGGAAVAGLLAMQLGPSALVGLLGGPLVDRRSRRALMIGADVVRAAAVASLLLVPHAATAHLWAVAAVLGAAGALFGPSLQAALPDLVPEQRLIAANAALSAAFTLAVTTGPLLGGFLVARFGERAAFAANAASFAISAVLVLAGRIPAGGAVTAAARTASVARDLAAGLRDVLAARATRTLLAVLALLMLGAALRAPLEPLLVLRTLHAPPEALGLVGAAWGIGMLTGSALATGAGSWRPERLLAGALVVAGGAIALAALVPSAGWLAGLWLVAGVANAFGGIAHDTLLQTRAPEGARGRTIAAAEAVLDLAYLVGVVVAGVVAAGAGPRLGLAASGAVLLLAALAAVVGLRQPSAAGEGAAQGAVTAPAARPAAG
jgi:predicted MFS family arabinose efflux permease